MRKRVLCFSMILAVVLSGCSWFDGSYVHVVRHRPQSAGTQSQTLVAQNITQLEHILQELTGSGAETAVIYLDGYSGNSLEVATENARSFILKSDPVGAFALSDAECDLGTNLGRQALAVNFKYRRSQQEIRQIVSVDSMQEVSNEIEKALKNNKTRLALKIANYTPTDFEQLASDLAQRNVDTVMEFPVTVESVYGKGRERVVELVFTYETSRENLRQMQSQVKPIFNAAAMYVSGDGPAYQKYSQLYAFLMERFSYKIETSITPAYSLLCHGVGDSRAFALVYAAMCRSAGLECEIVTGTRNAEAMVWNQIMLNGNWYHLDLLQSAQQGHFGVYQDEDMDGYVWDYSRNDREAAEIS